MRAVVFAALLALGCSGAQLTPGQRIEFAALAIRTACVEYASEPKQLPDIVALCEPFAENRPGLSREFDDGDSGPPVGPGEGNGVRHVGGAAGR